MAGVHQRRSGKYGVRITPKHSEGTALIWLGTFDTAEDTARACDAAVIKMSGASAVTNFEPCGQSAAKTNLKETPVAVAADYDEGSLVELLNDFLELSMLDFRSDNIIAGAQHDDLMDDLRPVEWQQVDELLKNMESTYDREALIGAAEILQKISLVGMDMVGELNQHK
ncbi:ethylene-responsive transcription factor SHINE 2-like [Lolium perenne]|uniref:ethylene-responsive transcription factor SHINE 2-like n=1 Tax=Lolium perenne TaxID=4522 RepID=UPI0021F64459|nr:ethylene-responsive transcription factor 14-like isoform X2 [Lolium perenne]